MSSTLDTHQLLKTVQQIEEEIEPFKKNTDKKIEHLHHTLLQLTERIEKLEIELQRYKLSSDSSSIRLITRLRSVENRTNYLMESLIEGVTARIKRFFRPHLGRLYQYKEPKPLVIPASYYADSKKIDNGKQPVISIVTPSFNQAEFLEKTILSVVDQHYPALQYIIQDGGSTDGSAEIIKRYQSALKHGESREDKGQSHALNLGFHHATGEIMAYLNSDDILLPGTLSYVANYFNQHPDVDVIYGHRILINDEDEEISRWVLPPHDSNILSLADYIPQETLFWRKPIWDQVGGNIDENFRFAMDWELLLRFKKAGAKFVRVPRFLGAFRVHSEQKTSSQSKIGLNEVEQLRMRSQGRKFSKKEISRRVRFYLIKHIVYNKLYRLGLLKY